jgi:hypothetical protein
MAVLVVDGLEAIEVKKDHSEMILAPLSLRHGLLQVGRLSSDSYKPRQLGSLHIEGRGRSTSKPSVLGPDKTIGEIGG